MEFSLSEFLAGSSVSLLFRELISYYRKKSEKKIDLAQNIKDIAEVHKIMEEVVTDTFFNRFMIFQGEDSAGVLAAGKNLYITAQYEKIYAQEPEIPSVLNTIQRWKADRYYYELFAEMLSNGSAVIYTDKLPKDARLRDLYVMQSVKMAKVYHLMTTADNSKVFYCSVASTIHSEATPEDRAKILSAVDKLTEIFSRHKKFY